MLNSPAPLPPQVSLWQPLVPLLTTKYRHDDSRFSEQDYTAFRMLDAYGFVVCLFVTVQYSDVIMRAMASQITSVSIVWSTVCSGADQRNIKVPRHWQVDSAHKGTVTRKMFQFDDVIMKIICYTPVTPAKPTENRQKSSNSGRDRLTIGIDSVLSVWCRFYVRADKFVGVRSFKHVWRIYPRQIVGCLSVIYRCGVGFVGDRSGMYRS